MRQSARRRKTNLKKKEAYKNAVKEVRKLTVEGKVKEANSALPKLYKILDKTAKAGYIKKNKAGRLKSRLAKMIAAKTKS